MLINPIVLGFALFLSLKYVMGMIQRYSVYLIIQFFTPWDEYIGEDIFMWYVDAIDLGLYDPKNPPMSEFDYPAARDFLISYRFG